MRKRKALQSRLAGQAGRAEWQANGPNALWQSIYTELDRLQACREG